MLLTEVEQKVLQACNVKNLEVGYENGVVILNGEVYSFYAKQLASQAVMRIGLRVENSLVVTRNK